MATISTLSGQLGARAPVASVKAARSMRDLVAAHDWSATALGPLATWPTNLTAIVNLVLDSAEPMVIWWGDDHLQIYNDAYAPRVDRGAGPIALGQPAVRSWEHGWASIIPLVRRVLDGGASTADRDFLFRIERDGRAQDTYWANSVTPVRDDTGAVRGVLLISEETTERTLNARRQHTLDALRDALASVSTNDGLAGAVAHAVALNPDDLHDAQLGPLTPAAASSDALPLRMHMTAPEVGVNVDLSIAFELSSKVPLNAAYRLFLERFTLLVATTRQRLEHEAQHRIVEAERDRLLLDAPVGAAVMIGEDLIYHLVNVMYASVSGRAVEAMVGKPFVEVFPELQGSPVHEQFKTVFRAGEPFVSQPTLVQIHRHGGALDDRYFTYNLSPLRTLAGQVYGLMVIAVDITVEVESRIQVEKLNGELQAAASTKDAFLALLGHELRNPLAPIVAALELMRLRDRSSEREQVVIRRQVAHLTRLVDDLLDVSRITRGKVELRKELADVREVLMGAVEMVAPLIAQKQQQLHIDVVSAQWYGDPARLAQIVSNLLTNASRYSQFSADIFLRASVKDAELSIDVSDNGSGFAAELLPHIFEPFIQGERKLHGAVGGLGIGLALVKNLTELHGGRVVARSEGPGCGSTFTVYLPLSPDFVAPLDAALPASAVANGISQHILVVDDNIDAADTLADLLRMHGHTVEVAYSPKMALKMFPQHHLDLAILDIGLPDMTGHELAGCMRATGVNPNIRYVAVSGFGQKLDEERSAAAGFALHLVKPIGPEAFDALLGAG